MTMIGMFVPGKLQQLAVPRTEIWLMERDHWEREGAAAGLCGETRKDCPYDRARQSVAWNMWVYGCENAQGSMTMKAKA